MKNQLTKSKNLAVFETAHSYQAPCLAGAL